MDAVMIDAMLQEVVRAERERIRERLRANLFDSTQPPWLTTERVRELMACVEEE